MTHEHCQPNPDPLPPTGLTDLGELEALRRLLFESSTLPIVVMDPVTHRFIDCNPAAAAIYGFPDVQSTLGREPRDVSAPHQYDGTASTENILEYIHRALAEGSIVFEWLHQRPNGERWDAEVHLARFRAGHSIYLQFTLIDITERLRAQQELRASEARYRYITDNTKDVIWILDLETLRFLYVSPSVEKLRGYTPEEILALPMDAALTADAAVQVRAMLETRAARLRAGGRDDESQIFYTEEIPQPCKDGSIVWTEVVTSYRRNPSTGRIEVHGVTRDISERKRQDIALRRERAFSDGLIDSLPGIFYVYDRDLRLRRWNRNHETAMGYSAEELGQKRVADWHTSDEVRRLAEQGMLSTFETGKSSSIEATLLHKDGTEVPYLLTATRVDTEQGPMVMGVGLDITSRKQAEEALKLSEARLRANLENTPHVAVQWYDAEGHILYWNHASEVMYGWTALEVLDKTLDACLYTVEDAAAFLDILRGVAQTGKAYGPFETQIRKRDGSTGWVLATTFAMPAGNGELGFVCMDVDITARKRAELDRENLQTQLIHAQKMEAIGRLAGGVAHDFNNILCVILGQTELLLEDQSGDESLHSSLQIIRDAAERSANLTRQLLAFARKQTIAPQILDLNESVASTLKMLRRLIGEGIELTWHPGRDLWPIKLDPSQLDQLLANLCVNARDAIDGVGRIDIETRNVSVEEAIDTLSDQHAVGDYVVLLVIDNGCGMTPETLRHVFEPFYTTKATGKGSGLGLATVYGIVKQNGGFVQIDSKPQRGSTFRAYLPRQFGQKTLDQASATSARTQSRNETVLVVEDEEELRNISVIMLRRLGFQVLSADRPSAALEFVRQSERQIHLLVTDVVLPEMNGRELWESIRTLQPNIRCLYMSGYTADIIGQQGVLGSDTNFIEKPFTLKVLESKVLEALK